MNYLIIRNNNIVQICESIHKLIIYLRIEIKDNGRVSVEGKVLNHTYNMKEFTKEEIIKDIERDYLKTIESILEIGIYKLQRI